MKVLFLLVSFLLIQLSWSACAYYSSCDPRCKNSVCVNGATTNYHCCTGCADITIGSTLIKQYWWSDNLRCDSYCPPNYFPDDSVSSQRVCTQCNYACSICTNRFNYTCSTCANTAFQLNSTACYNLPAVSGIYNPCPPPYYGLQITMTCQPCLTGCASCYIHLVWEMPGTNYPSTYSQSGNNCSLNTLCTNMLMCTSCNTGYTLINGLCISNNQCLLYSYSTSTAFTFNPSSCVCFNGYYLIASTICSICSRDCFSCSSSSTQCTLCMLGLPASGGTCSTNSTFTLREDWGTGTTLSLSAAWSKSNTNPNSLSTANPKPTPGLFNVANCAPSQWVFGYWGYDVVSGASLFPAGVSLRLQTTGYGTNHYGIYLKANILYIDDWQNSMSILFIEGNQNRFSHAYQMQDAPGEYLCGLNTHDHTDYAEGWFTHSTDSVDLIIKADTDTMQWGISQLRIYTMQCEATCLTCTGPTSSNCLTCAVANKVASNGICICDTANNYYLAGSSCTQTCPMATPYRYSPTATCLADCSYATTAPYSYKYIDGSGHGWCMQDCPAYKMQANFTCMATCYDPALSITANYYKYEGSQKVCLNICPTGTYADPISQSCVRVCPKTSAINEDGYFALNTFCQLSCSASTYAYPPTRICMASCPTGYYASSRVVSSNTQKICQLVCSVTLAGQYSYADNTTNTCTNNCPIGSYGDLITHTCMNLCNSSAYGQTVGTLRTCVRNCDSLGNNLFGNPYTGLCVLPTACPTNHYADPLTFLCSTTCTGALYFGDNSTRKCELVCSSGFKENQTKICVQTCLNTNNSLVPQWGDTNNRYCVQQCSGAYFGDPQQNRDCVLTCAATPIPTYGLNFLCVAQCSSTTWADRYHANRICTTSCTNTLVHESYGENQTRTCVITCPDSQYAANISSIPYCVYDCPSPLFGYPLNNRCQAQCVAPYYGDVTGNRNCVLGCPAPYFAQNTTAAGVISLDRICVLACAYGWADSATGLCATTSAGCTNNTYAHQTNHLCVVATGCTGFANVLTGYCVPTCPSSTSYKYFGDPSTKLCVLVCPQVPNYFGDNTTTQCTATCSGSQVRDPQNLRRCVAFASCSTAPVALFGDSLKATCVVPTNCSNNYYADNFTNTCNTQCQGTVLPYADPITKYCVSLCALEYYAYNSSNGGICSTRCPTPLWGDNRTVQCTTRCSSLTYGVNFIDSVAGPYQYYGICQQVCPLNQYARDSDNKCVSDCGTGQWGDAISRTCKTNPFHCPQGYYADDATHKCVLPLSCSFDIPSNTQYVADNRTNKCVSGCPPSVHNFADMNKFLCVAVCPVGYYGFNSTLRCQLTCQNPVTLLYDGSFADAQLNQCVAICSASPLSTFGENVTYTCVVPLNCPPNTWAEVSVYNRQCRPSCPAAGTANGNAQMYSYNVAKTCVTVCPLYFYGDMSTGVGKCVSSCPSTINDSVSVPQFADNTTKLCVILCPASNSTFGDTTTMACVYKCPLNWFALVSPVRQCVQVCAANTWGETIQRTCLTDPTGCPSQNGALYYGDSTTHLCVLTCPVAASLWGENSTRLCVSTCLTGFKYTPTRVCIDLCPAAITSAGLFSDQGMCYAACITPNYYLDVQNNRSCQPTCQFTPIRTYADPTTFQCVKVCPTYPQLLYAQDTTKSCVSACTNLYIDTTTQSCVSTCPTNTFYNADTNQCVVSCPSQTSTNTLLYGDSTVSRCVLATACSSGQYGDSRVGLCVSVCSNNQWINGKYCVVVCPAGYYGDPTTLTCVMPSSCSGTTLADNLSGTCVVSCPGTYANSQARMCVTMCPSNYFSDPFTLRCATSCTSPLIQNTIDRTCVSLCDPQLYLNPSNNSCEVGCTGSLFADPSTRSCVSVCPSTPPYYGSITTHTCVVNCPLATEYKYNTTRLCVTSCPTGFLDNNTRSCLSTCLPDTYADSTKGYCVEDCSPLYAYDGPNTCVSSCVSPYYRDPTTYTCVLSCPLIPILHYMVVTVSDRRCDTTCPQGQFRDLLSYSCVSECPAAPPTYADTTSGNCLAVCSSGFYISGRTCVSRCPGSLFGDNQLGMCVAQCSPQSLTYGDPALAIPQCVTLCSPNSFADPYTRQCLGVCGTAPLLFGFDNGTLRHCVSTCPYPYLADNNTRICNMQCISTNQPYKDQATQTCVSQCPSLIYKFRYMPLGNTVNGICMDYCPPSSYALLTNNSCVFACPLGYFADVTNNTCYQACTLANNRYADSSTNTCVNQCPFNSSYRSYADGFTRACVTSCPTDKGTVGDNNTLKCEPKCTLLTQYANPLSVCVSQCPLNFFADDVTQRCVAMCSISTLTYGYIPTRVCVTQCPVATLYADDATRLCVTSFSCSNGYWGLDSTRVCVQKCPTTPSLFGDVRSQRCVSSCLSPYYADPSTRTCVLICPTVPFLFGENTTRSCLSGCPPDSYADAATRVCVSQCSRSPIETYADDSTQQCVETCPVQPDYYALNTSYTCVSNCPSPLFADIDSRKCVERCPGGTANTFADSSTNKCVRVCPGNTYMQNTTRECVSTCTTGFADPNTKYCVAMCRGYNYAENNTKKCYANCPVINGVLIYAEDNNRYCMSACLAVYNTFRDPTTLRCVRICPIAGDYYAETNQRLCMQQCPQSPLSFADPSTRSCVGTCPTQPALFAINMTRVCVVSCPPNSWADPLSRLCLALCQTSPFSYGDNLTWSCVSKCPTKPMTYADNSTFLCVGTCPAAANYFADNTTQTCVTHCPSPTFADTTTRKCVNTCPFGYYAHNSTRTCLQSCPSRQFADSLIRKCVSRCTVDPIYYGNPDTLICVTQCPASNNSFGNPITQECVNYQSDNTSGCPPPYFADNHTRLCTQVCPMSQDTYGDSTTWKCVSLCPRGPLNTNTDPANTYANNSTMRCVFTCPAYPQFYAEEYSRRCVMYCLAANDTYSGSFADNSTRKCKETCPSTPDYYSDNSTRRCVLYCPRYPLTFADNSTRKCVIECPSTPDIYGDLKTLRCVPMCPTDQRTYADYTTRLCVTVCPSTPPLYAQNTTLRCLAACPNNSYADNSSRLCIAMCPKWPQTYADGSTNKCVVQCPPSPSLFADPTTQTCVLRCPYLFYAQNITRKCLKECPPNQANWADDLSNACVLQCPASQRTFGDNSTQKCVSVCPADEFTFADNLTRTCLAVCQNVSQGGYADEVSRACLLVCPIDSYGDITTRKCVVKCPAGWYANNVTHLCVRQCDSPYFGDSSTWRCVLLCPVSQLYFGLQTTRLCTPNCPQPTYASALTQRCESSCPSHLTTILQQDTFGYNETKVCVNECPYPLFGYPVSYVCVVECPNPYYKNWTDHRCYKCPNECASCDYPQRCFTCAPAFYLYSGACLASCPTFPTITYANPNGVCGTSTQCSQGFFALNSTKSCVAVCPSGHFKNITAQSCSACMRGCISCSNSLSCTACDPLVAAWSNSICYLYCSPTRNYYTATGCVNTCPSGSYLNITSCTACSSVCVTCVVTADNCLICASGYYIYNNLCIATCPTGTKPAFANGSLACASCSKVDCTTTPLTYQLTQFSSNLNTVIQVQFNQPVNITQQIDKIIRIQQITVTTRLLIPQQEIITIQQITVTTPILIPQQTDHHTRLLATSYSYLNYTIIDYGNGVYHFVVQDYSAAKGQLQFQITDASAIKGQNGAFASDTRKSIPISTISIFSQSDYNPGISTFFLFINALAIVILLLTCWAPQSVWMPLFDYLHLVFALLFINLNYPPNVMYSLSEFSISVFMFIPSFFKMPLPIYSNNINNTIYNSIGDFSFLRSMGYLYTLALLTVLLLLVLFILSKALKTKEYRAKCKDFYRESIPYNYMHGAVYLVFLPTLLFTFFNMRSYTAGTALDVFSILSSYVYLFLLLGFICFTVYKVYRLARGTPTAYRMLQQAYNFVAYQQVVLRESPMYYFSHEKNQIDITNLRVPRVNRLCILPFHVDTFFTPWQLLMPLLSYLHKLLTALFLAIAFANPILSIFCLLLLNLTYIVYYAYGRPFIHIPHREYNNWIYVHTLAAISIILTINLILAFLSSSLTKDNIILVGNIICALIAQSSLVTIAYTLFRAYHHYFQHLWIPFISTDIFKANYTVEHLELSAKYEEKEKALVSKLRTREEFLEAIKIYEEESLGQFLKESSLNQKTQALMKLRPTKKEVFNKEINDVFSVLKGERQVSHQSLRSSQRLSKVQRRLIREEIFKEKESKEQDKYEPIVQKKKQVKPIKEDVMSDDNIEDDSEYEFQEVYEEYPEGTPMDVIVAGCKKGTIIMP